MARTTPRVERDMLVLPTDRSAPVAVGSRQWYSWLSDEGNGSFFFASEVGSFTARKERRKRGGWYWIAYRSRGGKLHKTYIGRSEDLTSERLSQVMQQLALNRKNESSNSIQAQPLLTAKFTPPAPRRDQMFERVGLLKRLDACLRVKLTLVTAPAGFGKTTLLDMWYEGYRQRRSRSGDIAWISLDERDNDPIRFWRAIWRALQRERAGGVLDLSVPLSSTPQMPLETMVAALANARLHGVLILDDYHLITNARIHEDLQAFIEHLPPDLHIILSSRSEPPLSLGRIRIYGELLELRTEDFRLSAGESESFLREIGGVDLSSEELALLQERTEGWIAGLRLAALALHEQHRPGDAPARFNGSQRDLFDYFAEEVFARQSEEIQHFLLATALLPVLTPQLCAAMFDDDDITGQAESEADARLLLTSIERAGLFIVPLDEQQQSYRYHALFSEFLQTKLARSTPERIEHLQCRAACWYERQGMREEAAEHFLLARDMERAALLIEQVGEELLWKKGEVKRLLAWLQQLPGIEEGRYPSLKALYAWALLLSGRRDLESVEAFIETIREDHGEEQDGELEGDIAALRARIAGFRGDIASVSKYSQQALQLLPRSRSLLRADITFGFSSTKRDSDESYRMLAEAFHISQAIGSLRPAMFSSRYLAAICVDQGRLTEAEAILHQALDLAEANAGAHAPVTALVHIGLAELLYEKNDMSASLRHALVGSELGERSGEIKAVLGGCCMLARIFSVRGEPERAWQELWKAERVANMGRVPWMREEIASISVDLALLQQDLQGARRALRKLGIDPDNMAQSLTPEQSRERLTLARVWLAEERYRAVAALLAPVIQVALKEKRRGIVMRAQALQTLAFANLNEHERATQLLSEVLALAGPEEHVRLFLDLGEPMRILLSQLNLSGENRRYVRYLLEAFAPAGDERKGEGGLSEREYEVLQLVALGMSNQEIAEALVIALSTVKVHVRHICQKLDVQKRIQAVTKARKLGLL